MISQVKNKLCVVFTIFLNKTVFQKVLRKYIENIIGSSDLEDIHKYLLEKGQSDFIEHRVALSKVLSQLNFMIENYYQFPEEDIKNEYVQLKKLTFVWLIECNTKPEVDDQQ